MNRRHFCRTAALLPLFLAGRTHARDAGSAEALINAFFTDGSFNGVLLVGDRARLQTVRITGFENFASRAPVTAQSRFETGSISKWIASVVALRLVEKGLVALDLPISGYLPRYRTENASRITLRHLLSSRSGIPNDWIGTMKADQSIKRLAISTDDAVLQFASGPLAFEPGSRWEYSHSNWIVVQAILERVSGRTYQQLVEALVTRPLRLNDSGLFTGDPSEREDMAVGYKAGSMEMLVNPVPAFAGAMGGYYTSGADMFALMRTVFNGRLLSRLSLQSLMQKLTPEESYALGGRVGNRTYQGKGHLVASEYGSNGAFRMLARRSMTDGRTLIIANNTSYDHMKIVGLADKLMPQIG
jgi:CubicO group peptidase (beta-lactamase class C family)